MIPKQRRVAGNSTENFSDNTHRLKTHRLLKDDGRTLEEAVAFIRNSPVEQVYFFKDGSQVARFKGEKTYVNPSEASLVRMKDAIVLHNHPGGTSFSVEDVKAAVTHDAAQLIVVTSDATYNLIRPRDGWNIDFDIKNTQDIFEEALSLAQDKLRKQEARGEIFSSEKDLLLNHYLWEAFFTHFGIRYEKTKP
ncbi:MAG: hypothetical protein MUD08_01240 [Cytophagales bacterium]|jgi:hypothetical protein|nr:hypothetical protein [Cytophagales bacterium]